jgi:hypothetical protein
LSKPQYVSEISRSCVGATGQPACQLAPRSAAVTARVVAVNGGTATLDDAVVVRALAAGGLAVDGFAGVRLAAAVLRAATGGLVGWLGAALGTALGPPLGPPLGPMLGAGSSGAAGGPPLN